MEPYLGEIRCFSFGRVPTGWAACQGQLPAIQSNAALFSLLGTEFGGDGIRTFGLPNLQGRAPVHYSSAQPVGAIAGVENVTLTTATIPSHNHMVMVSTAAADKIGATTNFMAATAAPHLVYGAAASLTGTAGDNVGTTGGNQPHANMQPYTVLNYCIALQGIFPTRS